MFAIQTKRAFIATLLLLLMLLPAIAPAAAPAGLVGIDGPIGPASADHIVRGISRSATAGHQLVILKLDTPGGLDTSMRTVIKAILASPVPVATFVAPSGSRAASAGTYILYASHIAAMAPGTNLGAATPVEIGLVPQPGGDRPRDAPADGKAGKRPGRQPETTTPMTQKQVNDAAAYLRGLAQLRGRNADWAERAVRDAASLTAEEALRQNVIGHVAADVPALLAALDGQTVAVLGTTRQLQTRGAAVVEFPLDWRTRLLEAITHPGVALILMMVGIYGLVFEFMSPGAVVPGVVGAISLLLGLYALQLLPVNYVGLALMALGVMFMVGEAFLPSFGILGLGGVVAFGAGALMLIDTDVPGFGIPPVLIGVLAVTSALVLIATARLAVKTRRRPATSGAAGIIGTVCPVERLAPHDARQGWVRIGGELWQATGRQPLAPSGMVRVVGRKGLILEVVPADRTEGV